jgi:hypothetical protein
VAAAEASTEPGPLSLRPFIAEEFKESFVEIYALHPEERRLVTCIEVLSPANKRKDSEGWDLYLRKRQALLLGEANLVEIDLLRAGTRMPMLDPWPNSPYTLLVARRASRGYCKVSPPARPRRHAGVAAPHRGDLRAQALRPGHRLPQAAAPAAVRRGGRLAAGAVAGKGDASVKPYTSAGTVCARDEGSPKRKRGRPASWPVVGSVIVGG